MDRLERKLGDGEVRELRSPLRDKRTGKEAGDE